MYVLRSGTSYDGIYLTNVSYDNGMSFWTSEMDSATTYNSIAELLSDVQAINDVSRERVKYHWEIVKVESRGLQEVEVL